MIKNTLKIAPAMLIATLMFFFWCGNLQAQTVNNCVAASTGTFTFSVEPAIQIQTVPLVTLGSICPGCTRTYDCGVGPYMQFDVIGSDQCYFRLTTNNINTTSTDGHATLATIWYEMVFPSMTWQSVPINNPTRVLTHTAAMAPGYGTASFRAYVCTQAADCSAQGTYSWTYTMTVNYVCSLQ